MSESASRPAESNGTAAEVVVDGWKKQTGCVRRADVEERAEVIS